MGVIAWVIVSFIFYYQSMDTKVFQALALPVSIQGSTRRSNAPYVENATSTEQLKHNDRRHARAIMHPVIQPNLTLDEFWADKAVRGLWMGLASSHMLSSHLQKAKKDYTLINLYRVNYRGHQKKQRDKKQLLCQLKQQGHLRSLTGSEEPFASLGWQKLVPRQPLEQAVGGPYRTCAVVSSAGAILNSSLGSEIGE